MIVKKDVFEKLEYQKVLQYISKYCSTEKGREELLNQLPYDDPEKIKKEGSFLEDARNLLIQNRPPQLGAISDISSDLYKCKIEGTVLNRDRILQIMQLSVESRNFFNYLKNNSKTSPNIFNAFREQFFFDKILEHHIKNVFNENGEIKDSASAKLAGIRKQINSTRDDLLKSVKRIENRLKEKDFVQEDYLTLRDGRIVIPIKAEHKRHIKGFIHSESSTGQTVYIEPEETLELNNEIVSLFFSEKREEERILRELTKKIGESADDLLRTFHTLTNLDVVFAKASYAIEIIGVFPEIDNQKPFKLIEARHPIILRKSGRDKTVPLNITIDEDKVILITGPNAGGKTVVLKTIGLLALLVNACIPIPVDPDSNFHFYKKLFMDLGDNQSLEENLSTFSSHLSNINEIIEGANADSLVLIDEIGTGTDPNEGVAIANAVLIELQKKKSTVLATTHYGTLKLAISGLKGFQNSAMEFDTQNLEPTYKFNQGVPGSSYAFEIAKRIGLDDKVLKTAREFLDVDKHKIEEFLVNIEKKSQELETKLKRLEIENVRLSGLSNLYSQNVEKLEKEKKEILKRAKVQAEEYIANINKRVESVIKNIRESNAESKVIKESKKIIKEMIEENKSLIPQDEDVDTNFKVGDIVKLKDTSTIGKIIEITKDKKEAALNVGNIKMKVKVQQLSHSKEKMAEVQNRDFDYDAPKIDYRLDIRGKLPSDSEYEVVKFIDDAYSNGMERVEILHGKGSGVLKKLVGEILKKHEAVKSFYFAPIEFGGEGITIVELK